MHIGAYTFDEFKQLAENFHGYAAPGLLIGGYMVELAKQGLPQDTLFEAVVESRKCLPDAVQLLTLCSVGNNWMKIHNLGRYALSLFDKYTGEGVRVHLDLDKMSAYPEITSWFLKKKAKQDQDTERLLQEIESAGDSICAIKPITIKRRFLGHSHMKSIGVCPACGEAYPQEDGSLCRGCQGEAPYVTSQRILKGEVPRGIKVIPVEEAVGKQAAHDMTRIEPGVFKGPEFTQGQRISVGDVCRLQQMGRFQVAVQDDTQTLAASKDSIHENDAAATFAKRMAGEGIEYSLPPHEGKVDFRASRDGLLCVDYARMQAFNMLPDVMVASRQDATLVTQGNKLAGTRAIPLFLNEDTFAAALDILQTEPLFKVLPLRKPRAGIMVTGTEIFKGRVEDKFIPVISEKIAAFGGDGVRAHIATDEETALKEAIEDICASDADILITTGGMSVDPDDITRQVLHDAGLQNAVYGMPALPGTMSLVGEIKTPKKTIQVIGVPACALYYKTTLFDLILPRLLAGRRITRPEIARLGEGGFCLACKICTYPKCSFGK